MKLKSQLRRQLTSRMWRISRMCAGHAPRSQSSSFPYSMGRALRTTWLTRYTNICQYRCRRRTRCRARCATRARTRCWRATRWPPPPRAPTAPCAPASAPPPRNKIQ